VACSINVDVFNGRESGMSEAIVEYYDEERDAAGGLKREIGWTHAVWVATGAPALVLFSIGAIAATVGSPSWLVWVVSVCIASLQMFTYAEVCGMYTHKSGGTAISGSMAWLNYGKVFPAISAWTYWWGWTPVIAIGTSLASGYVLSALFPAGSAVLTWNVVLFKLPLLGAVQINATFFLSVFLVLVCFAIQSKGILSIARVQMVFAISSLVPLGLIGIVPLITGDAPAAHFLPFVPLAHDAKGNVIPGAWHGAGWTLFGAGLFIAAWSRSRSRARLASPVCSIPAFTAGPALASRWRIWSGSRARSWTSSSSCCWSRSCCR
jgi:amino acid transporter